MFASLNCDGTPEKRDIQNILLWSVNEVKLILTFNWETK